MRWRGGINKAEERIMGQRKNLRTAGQRPQPYSPMPSPPLASFLARATSTLCPGRSRKKPVLLRIKALPTPGTPAGQAFYLEVNGPSQWPDTCEQVEEDSVLCHEAQDLRLKTVTTERDFTASSRKSGDLDARASQNLFTAQPWTDLQDQANRRQCCRRRILGPPVSKELVPSTPFNGEFPSTGPTLISCLHFLLWIMGTESSGGSLKI